MKVKIATAIPCMYVQHYLHICLKKNWKKIILLSTQVSPNKVGGPIKKLDAISKKSCKLAHNTLGSNK